MTTVTQPSRFINHPLNRSRMISAFVAKMGGADPATMAAIRNSVTPEKLLFLRDHADRGQKSLGRIEQLRRRFLFKPR